LATFPHNGQLCSLTNLYKLQLQVVNLL
jgi:hypothetical protein